MAWNFNAVPIYPTPIRGEDSALAIGVKITKTYIDDSGLELFTADTTVQDAKENAEAGFIEEYAEIAKTVFSSQIDFLLNYSEGQRLPVPGSNANLLGIELRNSVEILNILSGAYSD